MERRVPNELLRGLLAEAGLTFEGFARLVNTVGMESGVRLHYDRTAVSHWLAGTRPRPPVPELVAEGLSRRLARRVSVEDAGLGELTRESTADAALPPRREVDAVAWLAELSQSRREALAGLVYSLTALSVPDWAHHHFAPGPRAHAPAKVGPAEVESAELMTKMFADADSAFGGGHARRAVSAYLCSTIVPWLRADAAPRVHDKLLATAARLAYLCGFMCFDDESHGAAQKYYLAGLRMAAEARDASGYAIILRALSVQARALGHHQQAVHLAEAAVRNAPRETPEQTRAFLLGQLAVAQAAAGDRRGAMASLANADVHLARGTDLAQVVGACHRSSLAHQHAAVAESLGDRASAITALECSIHRRPAGERRSRAITVARLAEPQFADGRIEQACGTWDRFLEDYPFLRSRRADTAMVTLRARTRSHLNNPVVRALHRRASALQLTTTSAGHAEPPES